MTPSSQRSDTPRKLSPEEKEKILESPPKGTLMIILIFGLIFTLSWLVLFFGRFLSRGPIS